MLKANVTFTTMLKHLETQILFILKIKSKYFNTLDNIFILRKNIFKVPRKPLPSNPLPY